MKEDDVYYKESAPGVLRLLRACLVAVLQLVLTSGKVKVAHLCLQILRTHTGIGSAIMKERKRRSRVRICNGAGLTHVGEEDVVELDVAMQKATGVHVVQSGGNLRGVLEDCACQREPVELVHSARDAADAEAWEDKGVVGRMGSCG
jgi:hypothetical protein